MDIRELKAVAEKITGTPAALPKGGRAVAKVIHRDGDVIDTIKAI